MFGLKGFFWEPTIVPHWCLSRGVGSTVLGPHFAPLYIHTYNLVCTWRHRLLYGNREIFRNFPPLKPFSPLTITLESILNPNPRPSHPVTHWPCRTPTTQKIKKFRTPSTILTRAPPPLDQKYNSKFLTTSNPAPLDES